MWRGFGRGGGIAEGDGIYVALDGQIFNRDELAPRDELRLGDAEIIRRLAQRRGLKAALAAINGDFAVAVLDDRERTLSLARDRVGVKPLYYWAGKEWAGAASQPRALFTLPGVSSAPNRRYAALVAASHYRSFDMVPQESPYADVAQIQPGTIVSIGESSVRTERYWSLGDAPLYALSEAELAEQYRTLLLDAVRRRHVVAGTAAFTLSGGLDSSSVLCCAVESSRAPVHAYSSVYVDATYDERDEIRDVVREGKVSQWHPVEIDNDIDVLGIVRKLVAIHEEPVATATWLSHFIVCGQVRADGFGALFGGLGGDELNAGEYEYFPFFFADVRASGDMDRLHREIDYWARYHDHPIYKKNAATAQQMMGMLTDEAQPGLCRPDRTRFSRYSNVLDCDWYDLDAFQPPMEGPFKSYLLNRCYQDLVRETTSCCLRAEDRQCTAYGLLHYDPFLDYRLVEFMFRIPPAMKIRDGATKHLLRLAMEGILPETTRTRTKKTGWNAPAHKWFSGEGLNAICDIVQSKGFRELGIYRVLEVLKVMDDHQRIVSTNAPKENHMMFLWQLVNLYYWLTLPA